MDKTSISFFFFLNQHFFYPSHVSYYETNFWKTTFCHQLFVCFLIAFEASIKHLLCVEKCTKYYGVEVGRIKVLIVKIKHLLKKNIGVD